MAEPITISNPRPTQCHQLSFTANGSYDTSVTFELPPTPSSALPAPSTTVVWEIRLKLSIPKVFGAPAVYERTLSVTVLPQGNWTHTFTVAAGDAGTNATFTAALWVQGETAPRDIKSVTGFDVLVDCTNIGGTIDFTATSGSAALAGTGAPAATNAAPPPPQFRWFSGTYSKAFNPPIIKIECVVQRRFIGSATRVLSRAEAELTEDRWAAVIHTPATDPRADDYLMVTFYTVSGIAVLWAEAKIS